jgi:hypothetical protein
MITKKAANAEILLLQILCLCYNFACCPLSLTDKAPASGAGDGGSIPPGGAIFAPQKDQAHSYPFDFRYIKFGSPAVVYLGCFHIQWLGCLATCLGTRSPACCFDSGATCPLVGIGLSIRKKPQATTLSTQDLSLRVHEGICWDRQWHVPRPTMMSVASMGTMRRLLKRPLRIWIASLSWAQLNTGNRTISLAI